MRRLLSQYMLYSNMSPVARCKQSERQILQIVACIARYRVGHHVEQENRIKNMARGQAVHTRTHAPDTYAPVSCS